MKSILRISRAASNNEPDNSTLRRSKMTDRILLKRGLLIFVLVTMVSISGALTQANGDDSKKEIKLKDAVVLEAKNRVRAKPGFRLVLEGKDTVVVFKKDVRIGPLKCSVCPGGQCTARVSGPVGACEGCGSPTGRDCTYDPF